jgi:copine 5/8/9
MCVFALSWFCSGIINDMDATIEALVAAADLPLSVLIVGVGSADFSQMNTLDADERRLSARGRVASRDIVQFVPLRNFVTQTSGGVVLADVSRALLAEIPGQLLEFMAQHKIMPNPRPVVPMPAPASTFPTAPVPAAVVPPPSVPGGYV